MPWLAARTLLSSLRPPGFWYEGEFPSSPRRQAGGVDARPRMTPATAAVAAPPGKGHPKGLYLLFFTEAFERFQYYGMRAFLVLYLVDATRGLGWSRGEALSLYGTYTGLVYLTPVLGGYIADRFLGQRVSVVLGGTL